MSCMHQFRGTDVGLGLLAIAVNVGLVVGVVVMTTDGSDERPPAATGTASPLASPSGSSTPSPSPSPTTPPTDAQDLFARDAPVTVSVLGDQTGDGEGEWVWTLAELLGRDRQVTLHQLDPQDPTVYAREARFGSSGQKVTVYNGSRVDAGADYGARRLAFLSPKRPDLVLLNYGRNDSPAKVAARLDKTAKAVRSTWPKALVAVTLQPPTTSEDSAEVRKAVLAWAKKRDVAVVDVARRFLERGDAGSYVSARDPSVMSSRGDALWGRTAYRLLVGADPPELAPPPSPTPVEQPSTSSSPVPETTPRTSRPTATRDSSPEPTAPAPAPTRTAPVTPKPSPTPSVPEPTPTPTVPEPTPTDPDPPNELTSLRG